MMALRRYFFGRRLLHVHIYLLEAFLLEVCRLEVCIWEASTEGMSSGICLQEVFRHEERLWEVRLQRQ